MKEFLNSLHCKGSVTKLCGIIFFGFIIGLPFTSELSSQTDPVAEYNFDNMDLSESSGNYNSGIAGIQPTYECGVGANSSALNFSAIQDTITLDPAIKDIMDGDFTLSLYFWIDQGQEAHTIFSIQDSCRRDSSFTIKYNSTINELRIEYARSLVEFVSFNYNLSETNCWHNIIFSKSETTYSFYIDGVFIENQLFVDDIAMGENFKVHLGYADCIGQNDDGLRGRIDNFALYNRAIDDLILEEINLFPDAIVSQDTTLFQGDSYQILTGASCANSISWTPSFGLDDSSSDRPIATPDATTSYEVSFDHGTCISTDTITISIVNEEDVDCNNLLLPSAFTPNNDMINDTYGISNDFIISDLNRYEIYDRWGLKLFEGLQKSSQWDGTYNGSKMMPGTYVYKIEYECLNNNYKKTGSFNLIK